MTKTEGIIHAIKERLYELKDKDFSKFNDDYLIQILCELDKIHLKLEENKNGKSN